MKNLFLAIAVIFFLACNSTSQQVSNEKDTNSDRSISSKTDVNTTDISSNSIPERAMTLIRDHFGNQDIEHVQKFESPRPNGTLYEVKLADHVEIEFDINGKWLEIDGYKDRPIPTSYLNQEILKYISTNFPNTAVIKVENNQQGFELELSNDIDLYFDLNGQYIRSEK